MDQMGESRRKGIKDVAKSLSLSSWEDGVQAAEKAAGVGYEKSQLDRFREGTFLRLTQNTRVMDRNYRASSLRDDPRPH